MRADAELFKDKIEVSLDGRQIFYLFFGGAVIASLVFVLGVMVGKRVEARGHVDSRPATSAALDPLAALDELAHRPGAGELAFPSALAGDTDEPLGEVDERLAAAAAEPEPEEDAEPAPARASASAAKAGEHGEAARKKAKFTLQISSFQDRAEADALLGTLRNAGHAPYMIEAEVDGSTWYRVRLGSYETYDAAIDGKMEFEKQQHIIAYVTRLKR